MDIESNNSEIEFYNDKLNVSVDSYNIKDTSGGVQEDRKSMFNFVQGYIAGKLQLLQIQPEIFNSISKVLVNEFQETKNKILEDKIYFSSEPASIQEIIFKEEAKKNPKTIEFELKNNFIKEARISKENLEVKIKTLSENIKFLENNNEISINNRKYSEHYSPSGREIVQENIRKAKIKQIKEKKLILENQLKTIENQIEELLNEEKNAKKGIEIKKYLENFEKDKFESKRKTQQWEKELRMRAEKANEYKKKREDLLMKVPQKEREAEMYRFEKKKESLKERAEKMRIANEKKHQEILKSIEDMKNKRNDSKKYIYEIKEAEFKKKEEEEEELNKMKFINELIRKKNIFRPITKEELDEFSRKYQEDQFEIRMRLERERLEELEKHEQIMQCYIKPDSQFYKKIVQEEKENKEHYQKMKLDKIYQSIKIRNFSKAVKENLKPNIDQTKRQELEMRIDKLKNTKKYIKNRKTRIQNLIPRDNKPTNEMPNIISTEKQKPMTSQLDRRINSRSFDANQVKEKYHNNFPHNSRPPSVQKEKLNIIRKIPLPKAPDYLTEMRVVKNLHSRNLDISYESNNSTKWEKMINRNNHSFAENIELIKIKAKVLEDNAKRKEKLIQFKNDNEKNKKLGEVSNLLIDSIRAKLTILDNLHKN